MAKAIEGVADKHTVELIAPDRRMMMVYCFPGTGSAPVAAPFSQKSHLERGTVVAGNLGRWSGSALIEGFIAELVAAE